MRIFQKRHFYVKLKNTGLILKNIPFSWYEGEMIILAFILSTALVHADPWGPNTKIRAPKNAYEKYPKVRLRDEPEQGGWWISPIHANLLEDGNVLLTGWARVQEMSCPDHHGRQWPASFLLNID